MAGRKRIEDSEVIQAKMRYFATLFCLYSVKKPERSDSPRRAKCATILAANAMGLSVATAEDWIKHPIVRSEIAKRIDSANKRAGGTVNQLLDEVCLVAYSDIANYFEKDGIDGLKLKQLHEMGPERRAIKTIKHDQTIRTIGEGEGAIREVNNKYEYQMWDKMKAVDILAEFHKVIRGGSEGNNEKPTVMLVLPNNNRKQIMAEEAEFTEVE
ncbi:MAG: terminase small subunit [Chloroflexi bacterium]|nr:terminase small subunit [Chloroflexota bacterium]MBE3122174.1 terminase small subunit [Thermoplasmata archaeon]MBE3139232.1 terminase small subunit [Thermoplasmata archaeon]